MTQPDNDRNRQAEVMAKLANLYRFVWNDLEILDYEDRKVISREDAIRLDDLAEAVAAELGDL